MSTAATVETDNSAVNRRRSRRERAALIGIGALAAAMVSGVAAASGPDTTAVAFIPLSPVYKLMTGTSIAAHGSVAKVVTGGSTTVPTNATTVQLNVTVKGAQAGTLSFYPTGNTAGGSGQSLSWTAGNTSTMTIQENVGIKNELTFANGSAGSATVTATITGYSTQVTAGDVNGSGGVAGQVLTNTGAGASWQPASMAYSSYDASYHALTPTTPYATVGSLFVPAGKYALSVSLSAYYQGNASGYFSCGLSSPSGYYVDDRFGNVSNSIYNESMTLQGLVSTTGGWLQVVCSLSSGGLAIYGTSIMATTVGAQQGFVVSAGHALNAPAKQPGQ